MKLEYQGLIAGILFLSFISFLFFVLDGRYEEVRYDSIDFKNLSVCWPTCEDNIKWPYSYIYSVGQSSTGYCLCSYSIKNYSEKTN